MGDLDPAREAGGEGLDHRHQVQAEEREVVQVILGERLAFEVRMDEPQAPEAAEAPPQAADVREGQALGVSHDDVLDRAVAREEHPHLALELPGDLGQVPGELQGNHLLGGHPPAEGPFEGPDRGGLQAPGIAVDVRDGSISRLS